MASGWDFFGIGIFYFGVDRKILNIPKFRGSGSGFENPEKIPSGKSQNPGDRDLDLKIPRKFRKIPSKKSRKIPSINRDFSLDGIFYYEHITIVSTVIKKDLIWPLDVTTDFWKRLLAIVRINFEFVKFDQVPLIYPIKIIKLFKSSYGSFKSKYTNKVLKSISFRIETFSIFYIWWFFDMFSTRRKLEENPKVKSNPLSVLSFSYLNNLFKKGAKTPLEAQDRNFKLLKLRLKMWKFNRWWPWCHDFEPFKIF